MLQGNHYIKYTAADIEKYWKGQLSAAEQHAMEKAALDDPFLADAMEGYEEKAIQTTTTISTDIAELEKRLAQKIVEKKDSKVIPFAWWKVAAAIIVMAAAGWLYTSLNDNTSKENIAAIDEKNKAVKEKPLPVTADSLTNTPVITRNDTLHDELAITKKRSASPGAVSPVASNTGGRQPAASTANAPEIEANQNNSDKAAAVADETVAKKDAATIPETKKETVKAAASPAQSAARAEGFYADNNRSQQRYIPGKAYNYSNTFSGNILDQSNKPVANASIQIPHLNIATQTDKWGNFSFRAADTVLNVSIASTGFETQNIRLHDSASLNQIVLKPLSPHAGDVVTQTNGAEKRKKSAAQEIAINILDAEPLTGWEAYSAYLEKNKKIPNDAKNIHGSVVVSFTVHSRFINNFKVEQSLDDDLDEEAIRLIRTGPAWKLLKGKKATATVIVKF